jgi:hypothetical protein
MATNICGQYGLSQTCKDYFSSNFNVSNINFTSSFTIKLNVSMGLNKFQLSNGGTYKKGSFIVIQMQPDLIIAINTSNSSTSDYSILSSNMIAPLNSSFNWRFCFKVFIQRTFYLNKITTNYNPNKNGLYNFGISLSSSQSVQQLFWSNLRFISKN